MFRLLFATLMIAQVLACPFLCASGEESGCQSQPVVKRGCKCCHRDQARQPSSAPVKTPDDSDECSCFCSAEFQHSVERPFGDLTLNLSSTVLFAVAWLPESTPTPVAHMLPVDPGGPPGRQLRVTLQTLLI
jgi:hypothetical protein